MMWMPSVMDRYRQERSQLAIKCRALKWVKTNNALPKRSLWWVPMIDGIILWNRPHNHSDIKTRDIQLHRMHKERGWIVTQTSWNMSPLNTELKAFTVSNWKTTQSGWRSKVHPMSWINVSHPPLVATLNWCKEKFVAKALWN
jgi:hypothetical protein